MSSKATLLPFLSVLFFLFSLSNGKFSNESLKNLQGCRKGSKVQGLNDLKLYLARFGYLYNQTNFNHVNAENDEFDEELEAALISYQNFYHLNETGMLDEPTISQMLMPRCGQPDKNMLHNQHGPLHTVSHYSFFSMNPKWPVGKTHLTYAFFNNYPTAYIPPVVRAFNTWTSASSYFTFSRASDITSADLKISFGSGDPRDGTPNPFEIGNVLAHAFAPIDGSLELVYAANDTYAAKDPWSSGPGSGPHPKANDLETVALHEIGHLLGLGHSQDEKAVMYPTIPTGTVKQSLNSDDIQGIKVLYVLD